MNEAPDGSGRITAVAALFEGGLGILAFGIGAALGHNPSGSVGLRYETLAGDLAAAGWGLLAALPLLLLLVAAEWVPLDPFRRLQQVIDHLVVPLFRNTSLVELLLISLLAGIGEELLFRGLIQSWLTETIGGPSGWWIALAVASVAFGLAHFITVTYVILAALIGAYLGLLFWWTDNLLAPIVAHAAYDFIALAYLVHWRGRGRPSPEPADDE